MPKRTPEEILKAIEDSETDEESRVAAEMERVLAMSSEQRRRELEAAGVDLRELDARADALHKIHPALRERRAEGGAWVPRPPPAPPRSIAPRWAMLLAAALAMAIMAGVGVPFVMGLLRHDPDASSAPLANRSAQQMRLRAFAACEHRQWQDCVDLLSAARDLDPAGDSDERVQAAWRAARPPLQPVDPDTKQRRPTP
ncbi:MAG: hypothetical protein M3O46_02725 [Myxococcota bacterium]|nr:hypothetical protein [Myxococcota bacterium]